MTSASHISCANLHDFGFSYSVQLRYLLTVVFGLISDPVSFLLRRLTRETQTTTPYIKQSFTTFATSQFSYIHTYIAPCIFVMALKCPLRPRSVCHIAPCIFVMALKLSLATSLCLSHCPLHIRYGSKVVPCNIVLSVTLPLAYSLWL